MILSGAHHLKDFESISTGSVIGPCLSYLLAKNVPSKLVWSTRNPRKTYGDEFVDEILSVQENPLIWDTDELGKPDMVELAYRAYKEFNAEAGAGRGDGIH